MFIAIIGTRFAGKTTVQSYLVKHKGFVPVKILSKLDNGHKDGDASSEYARGITIGSGDDPTFTDQDDDDIDQLSLSFDTGPLLTGNRVSFLTMNSPISSCIASPAPGQTLFQPLLFRSPADLLAHVTKNWRTNFVTVDLDTRDVLLDFLTRPFVLVLNVDAPLLIRYRRSVEWSRSPHSLEDFIQEHDTFYYGSGDQDGEETPSSTTFNCISKLSFRTLSQLATVHVVNSSETVSGLHEHLEEINLLDSERLRPGWDTYFMQLASLAAQRSNCMKRRVGAILVRHKRIVSTGYNGTPRGLTNCNEGGCTRCNSASETPDECLCLHAEENALLEAGRERVGDGSVLYCNTCPCLKCTIKIIQTGVKEVVYNLSYKVDDASAALFAEAGVVLRRHAIPDVS